MCGLILMDRALSGLGLCPTATALHQVKTISQQFCLQTTWAPWGRTGSQAKVWLQSRAHLPTAQEVPRSSPQSSWHQLLRTSWKHLAGERPACRTLAWVPALDISGWLGAWETAVENSVGKGATCVSVSLPCFLASLFLQQQQHQRPAISRHWDPAWFSHCWSRGDLPAIQQRSSHYPHY